MNMRRRGNCENDVGEANISIEKGVGKINFFNCKNGVGKMDFFDRAPLWKKS